MAERRMFAKTIIDSDAFLDMPSSAQALYFHLAMRADDDGFINNPKKIQRVVGASEDDIKLLILKKFIIPFESGVVVIKHWKIHNYIRNDRYKETMYQEEKALLTLKDNKAYTLGIPDGYHLDTQDRLGKDRLELGKDKEKRETYVSIVEDYTQSDELKASLIDFIEMRKKMKGFTTKALHLALGKLDKMAVDEMTKIDIVNQSVMNSWKSFYPLHPQKKGNDLPF